MAKTKTQQKKRVALKGNKKAQPYIYEGELRKLKDFFPQVKMTKYSERNKLQAGSDFFIEITLPSSYTLLKKSVSTSGAITAIEFSIPKQCCTENQKPGLYRFSV